MRETSLHSRQRSQISCTIPPSSCILKSNLGDEILSTERGGSAITEKHPRLISQHPESATPITVENDTIRINEKAMLYDTVYPVKLSDATYHIIFTSDGAIEIYEVAP